MEEFKAAPLGMDRGGFKVFLEQQPGLERLPTPLVTLSSAAIEHNLTAMAAWCERTGVSLAPHGKTTMCRELWQRQLDAGAWGITVATPWQASVALDWGIGRVLLANALVQPAALTALAGRVEHLTVWTDSLQGVGIMDRALSAARASDRLSVIVELGGAGGRTGVRSIEEGLEVARAVAASSCLRLAGVGGYEGALAHDSDPRSLETVRAYLEGIARLHDRIAEEGLYPEDGERLLTAGGSAYFDLVAQVLAPRHDPDGRDGPATRVLLRSGAYIVHDDGFYRGISPLARSERESAFRSGMHGWASVVSTPEPGLVLVDAGKRDFSFDEGLPEPQQLRRAGSATAEALTGAVCTAMNDQHTFVTVPAETGVEVGDVIRFGLSHPCTVMDKWRGLVMIDDDRLESPRAIGLLETAFG